MDARCVKFWEDGHALVQAAAAAVAAADTARLAQLKGKMTKEVATISRFLQKNQSQRFSDPAQHKLIDSVAMYVAFSKQIAPATATPTQDERKLLDKTFQAVKDGLAMPFNVFGTKQKKRLLKWHNELIGIVGITDPDDALQIDGLDGDAASAVSRMEWSVLDMDPDGYLSLLNDQSGETCESFHVKNKSSEFKQIKNALECSVVVVVTEGDEVVEVNVSED